MRSRASRSGDILSNDDTLEVCPDSVSVTFTGFDIKQLIERQGTTGNYRRILFLAAAAQMKTFLLLKSNLNGAK